MSNSHIIRLWGRVQRVEGACTRPNPPSSSTGASEPSGSRSHGETRRAGHVSVGVSRGTEYPNRRQSRGSGRGTCRASAPDSSRSDRTRLGVAPGSQALRCHADRPPQRTLRPCSQTAAQRVRVPRPLRQPQHQQETSGRHARPLLTCACRYELLCRLWTVQNVRFLPLYRLKEEA